MKKCSLFLFLLFSCLYNNTLFAQQTDHVLGEVLVQLAPGQEIHRWVERWSTFARRPTRLSVRDCPSPPLRIWRLHFDQGTVHEGRFLSKIRRDPAVIAAQFNHFIRQRETIPNDPRFNRQWQYLNDGMNGQVADADLDMELAWDITTGGLTADGDTIVVCVIDDGININHEDMQGNLWINHHEIPDNGIDDDMNGYVDDYRGWNILQDNDQIGSGGTHGTQVSGIIGAVGNNNIGVSGVNWRVKIMMVKNNFVDTEAAVIEAYSYPLIQRQRYNETNGREGAFVVATNASWGRDNGFPEDAPIWCGLYDSLGVYGILNCGATTNNAIDVDLDGDLPTTCPSDFLLGITSISSDNELSPNSGFGVVSIDLGAYGRAVYTLSRTGYGTFSGTSSATPHVAGAIGLLYAAPCPTLMAITKSDPAGAALLIRDYILSGVDPNAALESITVTGGHLNINNSLRLLMNACQDCQPPTSIRPERISDITAEISWIANDSISQIDLRWRLLGTTAWNEEMDVQSPYQLTELQACSEYEFQLRTTCGEEVLDYTGSRIFKTDGCCEAPAPIIVSAISTNGALLSWPSVLAADQYLVRWRPQGSNDWEEALTTLLNFPLGPLESCTRYEFQIGVNCSGERTDLSEIATFLTLGCGVCIEEDYCDPGSYDSSGEWIAQVQIGDLANQSGSDNGYGNYTDLAAVVLEQGKSYPIQLTPGYSGQAFNEYFLVYIDLNQDGTFRDNELVFDPDSTTRTSVSGLLQVPADAQLGDTRLRVTMQFQTGSAPCGQFGGNVFGEVEDYCVQIVPATDCELPSGLDTLSVAEEEVQLSWSAADQVPQYNVRYRQLDGADWISLTVSDTIVTLTGLQDCMPHEAQVRSDCGANQSIYIGNLQFTTKCLSAVSDPRLVGHWSAFPNPFRQQLHVEWELTNPTSSSVRLEILTASGQLVRQQPHTAAIGLQTSYLETSDLPAGLYLLRLVENGQIRAVEKLIKTK